MTAQASSTPIGEYGLLGDTRSGALVGPDGSVDWWCAPRFDDPPLFGRLVGGEDGGRFRLGPAEPVRAVSRRYRPGTATLETRWRLDGAQVELADALVGDVTGRLLPGSLLVRRLVCTGRPVRVRVQLAPRFGYGRQRARRAERRRGALVLERGDLALAAVVHGGAIEPEREVELTLAPGAPLEVSLSVTRRGPLVIVPTPAAAETLEDDERAWRRWSEALRLPSHHRDVVARSLITLRLLTYSPSGAPVAAPTTSLPEEVGGSRNWDYRYAWPRDASIGIGAFLAAGQPQQAHAFLRWLLHASRLTRPHLPVLFTVLGQPGPREQVLAEWPGYDGSAPVRRGNAARSQHQLDAYGWVLDGAWQLVAAGHEITAETWRTLSGLANEVVRTWRLPDAGIWEERGRPQHHVHSKAMAWTALDRGLKIARALGVRAGRRTRSWDRARQEIGAEVRREGVHPVTGGYLGTYGGSEPDAALLALPGLGFDPSSAEASGRTVDDVRRRLGAGGPLVYRYPPGSDGLPGGEGAFLPCSFWLVEALATTGRREEAAQVFDELCHLGGALGLYAEEMDPETRQHLGNYPQALTHATLVRSAFALNQGAPG